MGLRSLALTKSLRLLVSRKATRGVALKTLAQRGDEDRMLKCFRRTNNLSDLLVSAKLRNPTQNNLPHGSFRCGDNFFAD